MNVFLVFYITNDTKHYIEQSNLWIAKQLSNATN